MADKKTLAGPEPVNKAPQGINVSNSSTKRPRGRAANRSTGKARKEEKQLPPIGEKHQTWVWLKGGSGTFTLPSTAQVTLPKEDGKGTYQDTIIYSEGAGEVLKSVMREWSEVPTKTPIRMYNSTLHVEADNVTLQKYLVYLTTYGGFNDISLDDPEAEAMKEAEKFELIDSNEEAISSMDVVSLRSVANSLAIATDAITPKLAVVNRLRNMNFSNPEKVSKALNDDGAEIYFICRELFVNGYAEVNNNTIVFDDGDSICQVPANQDPQTFLAMQILNEPTIRKNWLDKFKEVLSEHYPS